MGREARDHPALVWHKLEVIKVPEHINSFSELSIQGWATPEFAIYVQVGHVAEIISEVASRSSDFPWIWLVKVVEAQFAGRCTWQHLHLSGSIENIPKDLWKKKCWNYVV